MRVLLVDDHLQFARNLRRSLPSEGLPPITSLLLSQHC
jgi:ActR/RegA family two-component response regulator